MRALLLVILCLCPLLVSPPSAQETRPALGAITGRVTAPDGRPVAAAVVALHPRQRAFRSAETTTDDDGRYTLPVALSGTGTAPPARPTFDVQVDAAEFALARRPFTLVSDEPARLDIALRPGLVVEGRVTAGDPEGSPVIGATVQAVALLSTAIAPLRRRQTHTDDDGGFRLGLLPRAPLLLKVSGSGWVPSVRKLEADTGTSVTFFRHASSSAQPLEVTITNAETDEPRPATTVAIMDGSRDLARARTDRRGRVRFAHLPSGSYDLRVLMGRITLAHRRLDLAGGGRSRVTLAVPTGTTLVGQVRRGDQRHRFLLRLFRRRNDGQGSDLLRRVTRPDGKFDVPDLPAGSYLLLATPVPPGGELPLGLIMELEIGPEPLPALDLNLATATVSRLECTVTGDGGAPVAGATVTIERWPYRVRRAVATSDAAGAVTLATEPGWHRVRVEAPGYEPWVSTDLTLGAGKLRVAESSLTILLRADDDGRRLRRTLATRLPEGASVVIYDTVALADLLHLVAAGYPDVVKLASVSLPVAPVELPRYHALPLPELIGDLLRRHEVPWRIGDKVLWIGERDNGEDSGGR